MTWTARAVVQDVSEGPAPIDVLVVASADEVYTTNAFGGTAQSLPRITSNTEGKIRSVEIRLQLDEDATSLKSGDEIQLTGHFQGKVQ